MRHESTVSSLSTVAPITDALMSENSVAGVSREIELNSPSIKLLLTSKFLHRPQIIFTAPEIRQFIAQGRRHRYSTNR